MKRLRIIETGELFAITSGECSDYGVIAVCRALQDIDADTLGEEYLRLNPEQRKRYGFDFYQFAKWVLVDKAVAEEVDCLEWYLGGYSFEFDIEDQMGNIAYIEGRSGGIA